jgi:hypothetical protein
MKDWVSYLRSCADSDVWGLVFLDYYHRGRKVVPPRSPAQFLSDEIPRIVRDDVDPVKFHRVLVCVCVQLLGNDFEEIFSQSLTFLRRQKSRIRKDQWEELCEHYVPYGKEETFLLRARSEGLISGDLALNHRPPISMTLKDTLPIQSHERPLGKPETQGAVNKDDNEDLTDLEDRVRRVLSEVNLPSTRCAPDQRYFDRFRKSGEAKAKDFLTELRNYDLDESRLGILSIGGSEGSEIDFILRNSNISCGILLEDSFRAAEIARARASELKGIGKELLVFQGDATRKIDEVVGLLNEWKGQHKIDGLACTMNAVLHELPARGAEFNLHGFLHSVVNDWEPLIIYLREPCRPQGWPSQVEMVCPYLKEETLKAFALCVARWMRLKNPDRKIGGRGSGYVIMPSRLAIETLFKLFYLDDFRYELEETVTYLNPSRIEKALSKELHTRNVNRMDRNSDSFDKHYSRYRISCRNAEGNELLKPRVFVRLIGARIYPSKS